jgi:hypothetical protein
MAKRTSAVDSNPVLSRKRTADLLRRLRTAGRESKKLKEHVTDLESHDDAAKVAREAAEHRRPR